MPKRLIDALYLLALALYVFAIPPTFHGDEAMQVYMSRDYATAFVDRNPAALMTSPPYDIDSDGHLRLINGTINRYAIGLSWHLTGLTADTLPARPGWDWGLDYDTNVSTGHLPSPALMGAARFSSTLFLALSVIVMFALGRLFSGRLTAYIVSGLYALNPVILLNGRRAMQEGSMLFFGLLVILIAALITRRRDAEKPVPVLVWAGLVVAGGLALASKHSSIVFVAGAIGWIFAAELLRRNWRALVVIGVKLAVAGVLMAALFVGLSPALWNDPPARFVNLLEERARLLDIQIAVDPVAPTTLAQRLVGIVTEPFMKPPQHFEVDFWGTFPAVTSDIERYMASPFSGVQFGAVLGGALTLLAGIGIVVSLRCVWARIGASIAASYGHYIGVLAWLAGTAASLIANPLPWQRYSLPLLPVATLLASIGANAVLRFVWKPEQRTPLSHGTSQSG